jgi:hypothetical protein
MRHDCKISFTHVATVLIAMLLLPGLAGAQDVTGPALKAAFIYNFAKFTQWPEDAPEAKPFVMCVVGDPNVAAALEQAVKDRLLGGNSIAVERLTRTSSGPSRPCRLLYLSGTTTAQATELLSAFRGTPMLTISDLEGFTELGGMVQFFYEHGQLRFSIGMKSAWMSRLQISAKILTLAIRK